MSALETSDDERPTNPLHFASQPARMPQDDGTIRPILERLNRGESAYAPPQHGMPVGIDLVDTGGGKRRAWTFIGCAALSAMLAAGVAIGAVAWLGSRLPHGQCVCLRARHNREQTRRGHRCQAEDRAHAFVQV